MLRIRTDYLIRPDLSNPRSVPTPKPGSTYENQNHIPTRHALLGSHARFRATTDGTIPARLFGDSHAAESGIAGRRDRVQRLVGLRRNQDRPRSHRGSLADPRPSGVLPHRIAAYFESGEECDPLLDRERRGAGRRRRRDRKTRLPAEDRARFNRDRGRCRSGIVLRSPDAAAIVTSERARPSAAAHFDNRRLAQITTAFPALGHQTPSGPDRNLEALPGLVRAVQSQHDRIRA